MEDIALNQFNRLKTSTISMEKFNPCLSNENDQEDITTEAHICIIFQLLLSKGLIAPLLATM